MAFGAASQLDVEVERVGEAAVVRVSGSAGMGEADKLKDRLEQLAEQSVPVIAVDLSDLEFICSAGLGALLSAYAKLRPHSGQLRLINPRPFVLRLLETTRLTQLFGVFGSVQEALASCVEPTGLLSQKVGRIPLGQNDLE